MAKQKLGRGFDALIPKDLDDSLLNEDKLRVQYLLISDIKPNPQQPRREIDEAGIDDLTGSIKRYGVLQPIIVIRHDKGYRIVAGERRWRAAKQAKLTHMPAVVRSLEELEQIELALIENIQRVDLSPLEQALSVYRLQHQFNLSLDQISEKLGKAPSTVSNLSRLLRLPEAARVALRDGKITEGHARAILSLTKDQAKQIKLLRCILDNSWNVRQAEEFAKQAKKIGGRASTNDQYLKAEQISKKIGSTVKLRHSGHGGQVIIQFKSISELEKILQFLNRDNG